MKARYTYGRWCVCAFHTVSAPNKLPLRWRLRVGDWPFRTWPANASLRVTVTVPSHHRSRQAQGPTRWNSKSNVLKLYLLGIYARLHSNPYSDQRVFYEDSRSEALCCRLYWQQLPRMMASDGQKIQMEFICLL